MIRQPRFAGRYYFPDSGRLRASIESFIEDAPSARINGQLIALLAPHGSLHEYGAIAGFAYKMLLTTPLTWDMATLLVPTAQAGDALLCDPSEAYDTLLEPMRIDHATVAAYRIAGVAIIEQTDDEPVVECHAPFIQVAIGDVPVLPLRVPMGLGVAQLDAVADRPGVIIGVANLPEAYEQAASEAISRLDTQFFIGRGSVEKPTRMTALFGSKPIQLEPSPDAAVLALALHLAKARGATDAQLLKREGRRAAFAIYRR
jgi:hypothetical protein